MLVSVLLFILGLILLIKGGDWFVDGSTGIAHRLHIPEILIGATVVSIGTTLPETMVSATSAVTGHGEIAYGNAIGSVICNTALIAAITIAVRPSAIEKKTLKLPVFFFFAAGAFYVGNAYLTGSFSRLAGIILLAGFVAYITVSTRQAIKVSKSSRAKLGAKDAGSEATAEGLEGAGGDSGPEAADAGQAETEEGKQKTRSLTLEIILLVVGAALIAVGARLLVDHGTIIARELGVPESVIALTFVALGTSLPELVTAITALAKGHGLLSLGNIVGANLFNLVLVSGLSATLRPFDLPVEKQIAGMNAALVVDTPVMIAVMLFLTVPALITGKLKRYQGIILLAVYAAFCTFQFFF